jgi:hypothetical protein
MPSLPRGLVLACAGDDGSARHVMRDVLPAADEEVLDAVATRSRGRRRRSSPAAPQFDAHPRLAVTRTRPLCPWPLGPHRPAVAQALQLPPRVPPPLSVVATT